MTFYSWLQAQRGRADVVGEYARRAISDKTFPQSKNKLHILLLHCREDRELRELLKHAHRAWRMQRDEERAA